MANPSNDDIKPRPITEIDAKRWLDVDFPGLEIGVAEYAEGPTGYQKVTIQTSRGDQAAEGLGEVMSSYAAGTDVDTVEHDGVPFRPDGLARSNISLAAGLQ